MNLMDVLPLSLRNGSYRPLPWLRTGAITCLLACNAVYGGQGSAATAEAKSNFTVDAGSLLRINRSEQSFLIPQGYVRSRTATYITGDSWWLEALWPSLTPWRENNLTDEQEFHTPGGGRIIKMVIKFDGQKIPALLNRMINEGEPSASSPHTKTGENFPDDTIPKRIRGNLKYGLQPYYIDFNKVLIFLNRSREVPIVSLDAYGIYRWEDWYLRRDKLGNVSTLIRCTSKEAPDPPDSSVTGKTIVWIPYCDHFVLLPKYNAHINIAYRRALLPQWQSIENEVRTLLKKFETAQP